jgi:DNA polymerase III epsilon subunit-like protein
MITADTPLKDCPLAVIDVESTGLDTSEARIVSIAVVHATIGLASGARLAYHTLVNPGVPIPPETTRIHGITDAMVADAPPFATRMDEDVADRVMDACDGRLVVAHNAPYEYRILRAELARKGRDPGASGFPAWPWLDTLVVRKATKTRGRPGRLAEIAAECGIALDAHGAAGDALTTALLVTPLLRRAWSLGAFNSREGAQPLPRYGYDEDEIEDDDSDDAPKVETVGALLAWQREAALWQEREFAAYCRNRGDTSPPGCGWHDVEGVPAPTWTVEIRAAPCERCARPVRQTVAKDGTLSVVGVDGAPHVCTLDRA